jgi:hypothetical protein
MISIASVLTSTRPPACQQQHHQPAAAAGGGGQRQNFVPTFLFGCKLGWMSSDQSSLVKFNSVSK